MRTLVLDGSHHGDRTAQRVRAVLLDHQPGARTLQLRDLTIGNCAGDFFCWVRSPGRCNVDDDNRTVAAEVVNSDRIVLMTPVTFGGYSSVLKQALDHLIQNISPFFTFIDGEVHHRRRYPRYPQIIVIGWLPERDDRQEQVFRHLAERNAVNLHAPQLRCDVLVGDLPAEQIAQRLAALLDDAVQPAGPIKTALADDLPSTETCSPPRRVTLLVGSPRTRTSNSHFIGGYLADRLADRGAKVEEVQIHTTMASSHRRQAAIDAVDAADLILLSCPLYVDSLPGPVTAALERLRAHREARDPSRRLPDRDEAQRLVALLNCGFPEPRHNATALAICAAFTRAIGAWWAGGLAVGAGEGVVARRPLVEGGRAVAPLRQALDLTADALAVGRSVPPSVTGLLAAPLIPPRLYTSIGGLGWIAEAHRYRAVRRLRARPYQASSRAEACL